MRGPGDHAERRADVGEHHLQQRPDADQQRGRRAHELEEQPQRQHHAQARAREQREVGADQRGHRAAGADDHAPGAGQQQHRGEVGHRAAEQEQQQHPPRTHRLLRRQAEDQQEHEVAEQVRPAGVQEQGGEQAQHGLQVEAGAGAAVERAPGLEQDLLRRRGPRAVPEERQPQQPEQQRAGPAQARAVAAGEADEHEQLRANPPRFRDSGMLPKG